MASMSDFAAVIMAGGAGQRFWPLSTADRPKQFLDLEKCGRSMLQATFDRLAPVTGGAERVFVVTGERYAVLVREQLPELPEKNLILEPIGRDTAPAIALAALALRKCLGNPIMGLFPSDHRVGNALAFQETLYRAIDLARTSEGLVTLGIEPAYPATGYGYIERGEQVAEGYKVARFVEKPNKARAEAYLKTGRYSWNGGIFLWRVETILGELERFAPELFHPLEGAIREGRVAEVFPALKKVSIDYAVLEKTDKAYVIPADFDWDDVGDWVALERLLNQGRSEANTIVGKHVGLETSGNIVYTKDEEDMVVTLGVENLVIVKHGNTVLLVRKDRVQDIKKLLENEELLSQVAT
jgi:mannose-1-phosphate guanylyltransferase